MSFNVTFFKIKIEIKPHRYPDWDPATLSTAGEI